LFMQAEGGATSFASLDDPSTARAFFADEYPDALALMPDFERQYAAHPVGRLATVYADVWHTQDTALLMGDAAHGIVPFHGQGLNACFEDCVALDRWVGDSANWQDCFHRFSAERRPNTDAIARMAIENYEEMRDAVRDPRFLLQKELSLLLERRHPNRFIPRYSMVMFHGEIPYAEAERRGAIQRKILAMATDGVTSLDALDFDRIDALVVDQLTPLGAVAS